MHAARFRHVAAHVSLSPAPCRDFCNSNAARMSCAVASTGVVSPVQVLRPVAGTGSCGWPTCTRGPHLVHLLHSMAQKVP